MPIGTLDLVVRDNKGSDNFIVGEVFQHQYYQPHPRLRNVHSIVDLGANAGFTTVYWSRLFPKAELIAVEPLPDNASVTRANCELNSVRAVIVQAACVAHDAESVQLALHAKDYGHYVSSVSGSRDTDVSDGIAVRGISMPTLLRTHRIDTVDLLKIDIEGYEKTLLCENAEWLRCVRAVVIEWHFPDADTELAILAAKHGFSEPELYRGQHWLLRP